VQAAGCATMHPMRFLVGLLDLLLAGAGLHGLTWAGRLRWWLLTYTARPSLRALGARLLPALLLQLMLAAVRRRREDPLQRLQPGRYRDRTITRHDLPTRHGPLPALTVLPHRPATRAVLVAHGSGCDKTFYAWPLVDALLARGLAVTLIDLEGHGENPRPQAYPAIVDTVVDAVAALRQSHPSITLLGMSLGGAVSAAAAAAGADIERLVLWEVPPRLRLDAAAYRRVQLREALGIFQPHLLYLFRDAGILPIIRAWRTSGIRASIGTWDLFDHLNLLTQLNELRGRRLPTLLIYAGRDAVVPPPAAAEVAAAAAGWAEFQLLPHATHISLPLDRQTLRISADWLSRNE
jgi:pimeloyl-ACP methyl ester carboxylesterase